MAPQISPLVFDFLRDLKANNNRGWFEENKGRYLALVRDPMLEFVGAFAQPLAGISPHFLADTRPNGGSLFRIYRDTRFSKDKTPYKTNVGARFRHVASKEIHAPGYYLHLEPGDCFAGCGIWHPDGHVLGSIRESIVARPDEWKRTTASKTVFETFSLGGSSLRRPPRGYDPSHPLIDHLRRKDFVIIATFSESDVLQPDFLGHFTDIARKGSDFVRFLAQAVGVPF